MCALAAAIILKLTSFSVSVHIRLTRTLHNWSDLCGLGVNDQDSTVCLAVRVSCGEEQSIKNVLFDPVQLVLLPVVEFQVRRNWRRRNLARIHPANVT